MLKTICRVWLLGLLTFAALSADLKAVNWAITSPTMNDQFANNVTITVTGTKPNMGSMGNAYLKREINNVFTIITDPAPFMMPSTNWSTPFTKPDPSWTNGNYKGHSKDMGGGNPVDGDTFTVVNP